MKTVLHKANTRGHANHGWLNTHHTFSFANYMNPERMNFGALRVLNDDIVAPGMGFGTHPHDNMEIISIPLRGDLEHKDNMEGIPKTIKSGDVQIMSAGTGVFHSEYNPNDDKEVNFLQVWVFPKERDIEPRYDQKTYTEAGRQNQWQTVVSPEKGGSALWINQDAWFSLGKLEAGKSLEYKMHKPNSGLYTFVLNGQLKVANEDLQKRDGLGVWDAQTVSFEATQDAEVLLMEVPMQA